MLTRRALLSASVSALVLPTPKSRPKSPSPTCWVFNESTAISDRLVRRAATVCQKQFNRDVVPAWHASPATLVFHNGKAEDSNMPANAQVIVIKDEPPNGNGLGGHWRQDGHVWAEVYAKRCLSYSSTATSGPYAVSMIMAHEIIESWGNPGRNRWVDDGNGHYVDLELCDPVTEENYNIDGVRVSNFVLPTWFEQDSVGPWDFLGKCSGPFRCAPGGRQTMRRKGPR